MNKIKLTKIFQFTSGDKKENVPETASISETAEIQTPTENVTASVVVAGEIPVPAETKAPEKKPEKPKLKFKEKKQKKAIQSSFMTRLSVKDQTHFMKRLSFLIRSGVPVLDSLHILRDQFRSKAKARMMDQIIGHVENGQNLSTALAKFKSTFGSFAINIIKVGEMSGNLSDNLVYLATELKKRHELKRKVIGALVYPAIITLATIGLSVLLTVFIFPKIMPIFMSLNVHLPFTTRFLIFMSDFLRNYGLYVLGGLVVFIIAFIICLKKIPPFHFFVARTILRLPLLGKLVQSYNITNFCRTFSLLLKSGFNVVEATTVAANATANPVYARECHKLEKEIVRGERVSKHLKTERKLFPDMVTHMIAIGETSGNLSDTLMYLAEHYEAELDDMIKNLSSTIEPVLMVFMGLIVGFVAVSVITPIYEITQNLSR